jgi:hypothetical protein
MVNLTRQRPVKFTVGFLSVGRGDTGLEALAVCPTTRSKNEITKTRIFVFLVKVWFTMILRGVNQAKQKKNPVRLVRAGTGFYEIEVVVPLL